MDNEGDKKQGEKSERTFEEMACVYRLEDDDSRFDLTRLQKKEGFYFNNGYGFNFCTYLPETEYFATYSDLSGGL